MGASAEVSFLNGLRDAATEAIATTSSNEQQEGGDGGGEQQQQQQQQQQQRTAGAVDTTSPRETEEDDDDDDDDEDDEQAGSEEDCKKYLDSNMDSISSTEHMWLPAGGDDPYSACPVVLNKIKDLHGGEGENDKDDENNGG